MRNSKTQTIVLSSLYFSGVLSYNIFTLYSNSVEQLTEYRKTKQYFKNDLDAIVSGCQKNWFDNLLLSLFWPIRLPFRLIPIVILYFNSNDSNEKDSFIKYEVKKCINIKNVNDTKKYIKTIDKMKNENYESNKENTEYTKENSPTINDSDIEGKQDIPINKDSNIEIDTVKEHISDNNSNIEITEPIKENIPTNIQEIKEDLENITNDKENLKFNFGTFNEEVLFDFSPPDNCQFNFSIKS